MNKIIITLFLFVFFGCKTKHKIIEREKEITETKLEEKAIDKSINDIKIDSFAKKGSNHIITSDLKSIELTQADSDKTITLEDNKGFKMTIKGANAIIKESKESQTKKDSSEVKVFKSDKSETTNSSSTKEDSKSNIVQRKSDSDVETTSTWLWVLMIIGAAILIFVYRNKIVNLFKRISN